MTFSEDPLEALAQLDEDQRAAVLDSLPDEVLDALLTELPTAAQQLPPDPIDLAAVLGVDFTRRPHLDYLAKTLTDAAHDVENGKDRRIIVEMPPRSGKTYLTSQLFPTWMMQRHPEWPLVLTSHAGQLATSWGRQIRRWVESGKLGPKVQVAPDAGAVSAWETTAGGSLLSVSIRESLTGRGARAIFIDDPHKDFVDAHSPVMRDAVWDWWLSVAQTRLQPPSLVVVVMTRWHENDLVGRLLSSEYPGDPDEWTVVRLPALADSPDDALGRAEGQPLLSPIVDEDETKALKRWASVKETVGAYVWSAMYQQRPTPAEGAIFDLSTFRYHTQDPSRVTGDGRVVLTPNEEDQARALWVDSWDCAFKGSDTSDYTVGQRWARIGPNRFLMAQTRQRFTFTQTIAAMQQWANPVGPIVGSPYVNLRLIEDRANGPAIIDTLKREVAGIKPTNPVVSKEARARAITPEVESGHVYLPHPSDPGNEWVAELISEIRAFPSGAHDDQLDALTQALAELRTGNGSISVPGVARTPAGRLAQTGGFTRPSVPNAPAWLNRM